MTPELKKKWIDALRSDKYKQGTGQLVFIKENERQHCCLGVLCEEICESNNPLVPLTKNMMPRYSMTESALDNSRTDEFLCSFRLGCKGTNMVAYLSPAFKNLIGLPNIVASTCIDMNDDKNKPFAEIADYLEKAIP